MSDHETPQEKWGGYLGITAVAVPGMIASGFMPEWNVLPLIGWAAIASAGAAAGGFIAGPRRIPGLICGALMGSLAFAAMWAYVPLRAALTGSATFLKLELVAAMLAGAVPGAFLYLKWARQAVAQGAT